MRQQYQMVNEISPHCLLIDVSSNDLCDPQMDPFEFPQYLFNFGQHIALNTMITHLFIMKLLFGGINWEPGDGQSIFWCTTGLYI